MDDIDGMTHGYAEEEAQLAEASPMPDPADAGRGVWAGDELFVPRLGDRQVTVRRGLMQATYLEAIRQGLGEEMARDPRVFIIGEDVGAYGGAFKVTEGLLERFGRERVIDTPISETAIIGAAIGAAYAGMRPVAEMQFIDFLACGFNIFTNFAAREPLSLGRGGPDGGPRAVRRRGAAAARSTRANPEAHFLNTPG